jgi:hypothetical protein
MLKPKHILKYVMCQSIYTANISPAYPCPWAFELLNQDKNAVQMPHM